MSEREQLPQLEQLLVDAHLTGRIAVKYDGRWTDGSALVSDNENERSEYVVRSDEQGRPHYALETEDGEARIVGWKRFELPLERDVADEESVDDDIVVVVEVSDENQSVPATVPWEDEQELRLSSTGLERENGLPPARSNRVAGLESEKQQLRGFLQGVEEDWGLSEPTGIVLEGPPGTGKTELVMEVCQEEYGEIPVVISGPEILNKWVGESERLLREKFEEARKTKHKVLYIDELDAIARSRSDVSESYSAQIVAQLLVLLDGVTAKEQSEEAERPLKVVASTNLSHVIDPALRRPGRLGNRSIEFRHPDTTQRKAILHHYLERIYTSDDGELSRELQTFVDGRRLDHLDSLITATDGFTGADIEDLVQESVRRLRSEGREKLTEGILRETLEEGAFKTDPEHTEKTFAANEFSTTKELDEEHGEKFYPKIREIEFSAAERAAKSHFREIHRSNRERDLNYTLRILEPGDFLSEDLVRSKERTVQAFQHRKDERVVLYIKSAELLSSASERSQLVERIVGLLHEQLLQWHEENLLLLPEGAGEELFELTSR